jgi:circadian clock protein KaiB
MKMRIPDTTSGKHPARCAAGPCILRLFVAGPTVRSRQAVVRVRNLCQSEPKGSFTLEVIDIYQQPQMARKNQIVATPTLVREFPTPKRRFIGNMVNMTGLFGDPQELFDEQAIQ